VKADPPSAVSPPSFTLGSGPTANQALIARVVVLPPSLTDSLERILTGTVVARDARGHVTVQTRDGEIRFVSRLALPVGAPVTLELQAAGATITAIVLSVNGKATGARPSPLLGAPPATEGPGPMRPGASGIGTADAGRIAGGGGAAPASPLPMTAPGEGAALAPGQTLRATLLPQGAVQGSATSATGVPQPLTIRVLSVGPENAPGAATTATSATGATAVAATGDAPRITGVVVPDAANGQALLRTSMGILVLAPPIVAAPGREITFEILPAANAPPPDRARLMAELADGWSSLRDVLAALRAASPAAADALAARVLAQPGPGLAGDLLAYVLGLKAQSARHWIGESASSALDRAGRGDLLGRLADEFATMSRLGAESQGSDWRTFLVPLYWGGEIRPIRMFLRQPKGGRAEGRDPGVRFVVEADLTALGQLQIDGLSHHQRLDMIIRTHAPLAAEMRTDIEGLFNARCAASGLAGSLGFQSGATFKVSPLEEIVPPGGGVVI